MDRNVPKKNLEQLRVSRGERFHQGSDFALGELPRHVSDLSIPEAPQKMCRRPRHDVDLVERKISRILPFLRDYSRVNPPQACDLPVDVQHLRLEESRAVKSDDRLGLR